MEVAFSKSLYGKKAILDAMAEFSKFAVFSLHEKGGEFRVTLTRIDPEFENIIREEFCNYVLALMKK